ncbi:MAG: thiamine-phosphate kinase [Chloroflexi bacterium]|nr:thiamine-phosphate kinase [Chloroflexota bacterium]MBI3733291.1 thiamine-phosphate kinase [Chloroflexota bacterium]
MKISELGEFGLIERIRRQLPPPHSGVVRGVGDDTAVLRSPQGGYLLATCDVQVAGRHFLLGKAAPDQIGRKALAVNLSDIAAMGGTPTYALVSLGLPADLDVEFVDALYRGLNAEAARFGVSIVGGNLSSAEQLFVDVTLLGEVEPEHLLLRSNAKPDDVVMVTGDLGAAAVGLDLLQAERAPNLLPAMREAVLQAALTPTPRVKEGQIIARSGLASAMIDISDGLAADLGHICDESRVSVRVFAEPLPIANSTVEAAVAVGRDPLDPALHGGEDYELLVTAPRANAKALIALVQSQTGTPLTIIGDIIPPNEARTFIRGNGRMIPLHARGWNHFR